MMFHLQQWLRAPKLSDPLEQRQAPVVQALILAVMGFSLAATPFAFFAGLKPAEALSITAIILLEIPIGLAALFLLRRDRFIPAVLLTSGGIVFLLTGVLLSTGTHDSGATMFVFAVPIVLAGLMAGRRGTLLISGLSTLGISLVLVLEILKVPWVGFGAPRGDNAGGLIGGFIAGAAMLGVLVVRFGGALRVALLAALEREGETERQRAALEVAVAERTADLRRALEDVESRASAQAALLGEIEQQRKVIQDLSVPVLPVHSGTLVLPLVGSLDSARLAILQQRALSAIERSSARRLILDISGVPVVDSEIAAGLLNVVRASRLLGAEAILAGIRPEVAQALVGIGIALDEVRAYSDLAGALHNAH